MPNDIPPHLSQVPSDPGVLTTAQVAMAGADGLSPFPGEAAHEARMARREDPAINFVRPPTIETKYGPLVNKDAVKKDFFESQFDSWSSFCSSRGYDPKIVIGEARSWEIGKRNRSAWNRFRKELEDESVDFGPRTLLRAVRAAKRIPESYEGMLNLVQHAMQMHLDDAHLDMAEMAKARKAGRPFKGANFRAGASDLAMLTGALKMCHEGLFKALGIDSAAGINLEKWQRAVEEVYGQMDAQQSVEGPTDTPIKVEVIGGGNVADAVKEAIAMWMDKPGGTILPDDDLLPEAEVT